jgi:hypothetical protein
LPKKQNAILILYICEFQQEKILKNEYFIIYSLQLYNSEFLLAFFKTANCKIPKIYQLIWHEKKYNIPVSFTDIFWILTI